MNGTAQETGPPSRAGLDRALLGRYAILLGGITAAFAIEGVAEPGRWELVLISALLGFTLILSLRIAEARPVLVRAALIVVVLVVAFGVAQALAGEVDERASRLATCLLVVFAPPAIVIGVVRRMRETQSVTVEAVIGVLCVYLLVGMFYSFIYGALDNLGGQPFFAGGQAASVAHCMYFSFTTLATVGYGDFTARTNLGHTLSVSEGLLGQVYLVTVVSLIVGNLGRRRVR
ncbi:MAG TPA: potassium channel family protein [Solirubrobacteraceae bacterium]|nr:potassium channel family protein [Solirubrobacteraceae bacterium]